jgi:uncharacterized protein
MLTIGSAKVLGRLHAPVVAKVLAAHPESSCLVAARFEQVGMDRAALGGQFWGIGGGRDGLAFDGANLVPLAGDVAAMRALAQATGRRERHCASILGPAELVLPLWENLADRWTTPREIRAAQPLLACTTALQVPPDPQVRLARSDELEPYYPAAVAMFTEEVGVDPRIPDGGAGYRSRVAGLLAARRAYARFEDGRVVFKAEIGALSRRVALIQGVWVAPDRRGEGIAARAVAAVVQQVTAMGRIPTLYVNDFNTPARAAYRRVGFRQIGTFASVLF